MFSFVIHFRTGLIRELTESCKLPGYQKKYTDIVILFGAPDTITAQSTKQTRYQYNVRRAISFFTQRNV